MRQQFEPSKLSFGPYRAPRIPKTRLPETMLREHQHNTATQLR